MKKLICLGLLASLNFMLQGQGSAVEEKPASVEKAESASEKPAAAKAKVPLRIKAETSVYDSKNGTVIFKKNVQVEDAQFRMECDEMTVYFKKEQNADKQGKGKIEKIVAVKNVKLYQAPNTGTADQAVYLLDQETVTLTGNPVLYKDGQQPIRSTYFIFHIGSERVETGPVELEGI